MASVSARGLGGVQAAEIDGHEQRGHLVVGDFPGGEFVDKILNLVRREGLAVAFGFDERKKVHGSTRKLLRRDAGVVAAEAEGVVEDGVHLHFARGVRDVIQIAFRVGDLVD